MSKFKCSICNYISPQKESVIRHINKKKSCGLGIKELIEIPIDIKCEYCNKNFSSSISLRYHSKNTCKQKDKIKDEEIERLKEENRRLKEQSKTMANNTTINNTINATIIINYLDTKTDHLTDKTYNKLLTDSEAVYQIIPELIKQIHFNVNKPENHNVYISNRNKNNKYMQVYNNKHWESVNKTAEIDNIINDKENNLSDWINEKGEKYPEAVEKFNEYLEQKYDAETAKLLKDEVELVMYNHRHMIKNI